jgi:sugar phosphate permease
MVRLRKKNFYRGVEAGMKPKAPVFYGWYLVAICIISMILIYGIRQSFAVFFSPILEEFRWSRGDTAMMMSLNILAYGVMAPIAGGLADRWRPRVLMPVGVVILGVSTAACAVSSRLWHFYLLFGFLVPMGSALSGWPILAPALMNWFEKRRGLVLGLGQMGGGLSFVYTILIEFFIRSRGWRYAFLALSFILTAALLPLFLRFFFYRPQDKGMTAYGAECPQVHQAQSRPNWNRGKDVASLGGGLKEVLQNRRLWLLVSSYALFWGIAGYMVIAHQVRFMQDQGFSSDFSASIYALLGVMIVFGQFSAFLSDRLGREKTHSTAACLSIGGLVALLAVNDASQVRLMYAFAVLFGCGAGLATPVTFAACADIFHGRYFGTAGGLVLGGMGVGSLLGPWLGGYFYDIFGSYKFTFVFCMISLVFSNLFLWFAAPRKGSLKPVQALDTHPQSLI